MRKVLILAVALLAGAAVAGKGKGGGGGGNTTPPDILFQVHINNDDRSNLYAIQDDGSGQTFLAISDGRASWSPDGTEVAFWSDVDGPGIYVMDIAGGGIRKVVETNTTASWSHFVAWSPAPAPDGEYKLAFTDAPLETDGTLARDEVFLVNLDGTGLVEVSHMNGINAHAREISWSPDAGQLAFLFGFPNKIWILDLTRPDASGLPALDTVYSSSTLPPSQAEWAKTSNRIAFSAPGGGNLMDLYVIDVGYSTTLDAWTASAPVNITGTPDDEEGYPSWSPDDSRIVCRSTYWRPSRKGGGTTTLAIVPVGTGTRQTLLNSYADYPVWKRSVP